MALLVLLAAAMQAGRNALIKVEKDRLPVMTAVTLFGSLVSLAALRAIVGVLVSLLQALTHQELTVV